MVAPWMVRTVVKKPLSNARSKWAAVWIAVFQAALVTCVKTGWRGYLTSSSGRGRALRPGSGCRRGIVPVRSLPAGELTISGTWWPAFIAVLGLAFCNPCAGIADEDNAVEAAVQPRFKLSPQHFDQLVFRNAVVVHENGKALVRSSGSIQKLRSTMETAFAKEIQQLEKECQLTEKQKKKIQLAARGDIVRFVNRVEGLREKSTSTEFDQAEYAALVAELQGLSYVPSVIVSAPSSLFRKSLRKCLTKEQVFLYAAAEHNRQIDVIERALDQLDRSNSKKTSLNLSQEARRKFIQIVVANARIPPASHPFATTIIFIEAGKEEERFRNLLTPLQWENFQQQVSQARRMEQMLQRMGVWSIPAFDEDPDLHDEGGT
jgi:hypothetical protein